jgi:hypothetical protein
MIPRKLHALAKANLVIYLLLAEQGLHKIGFNISEQSIGLLGVTPPFLLATVTISIRLGLAEIGMHPNPIGGAGRQKEPKSDEYPFHGIPPFGDQRVTFDLQMGRSFAWRLTWKIFCGYWQ